MGRHKNTTTHHHQPTINFIAFLFLSVLILDPPPFTTNKQAHMLSVQQVNDDADDAE